MSAPATPGALSVTLSLGSKAWRECEYQLNCFCPQIPFTPLPIDEDYWQRGCRQFLEPIGKYSVKSHQPMARSGVWRGVLHFFSPEVMPLFLFFRALGWWDFSHHLLVAQTWCRSRRFCHFLSHHHCYQVTLPWIVSFSLRRQRV